PDELTPPESRRCEKATRKPVVSGNGASLGELVVAQPVGELLLNLRQESARERRALDVLHVDAPEEEAPAVREDVPDGLFREAFLLVLQEPQVVLEVSAGELPNELPTQAFHQVIANALRCETRALLLSAALDVA